MQHILLIEDDALIALDLCTTLQRQGYRVSHALNGQEGLDLFRSDPAVLVITDLNMPVLDGYGVISALSAEVPAIKIVVIAGVDRDKTEDRLLSMGIATMLTKPVNPSQLLKTVRCILDVEPMTTTAPHPADLHTP